MQFALPIGSLVMLVASVGAGIVVLVNARHQNQIKRHEIDPEKPSQHVQVHSGEAQILSELSTLLTHWK